MDYSTQQLVIPKIKENPLQLEYFCQDPFQNMFEATQLENFQDEHEFKSPSLPLLEDYNQIPDMGFEGLEDFSTWDFPALDITTTVSSPSSFDYNVLDEKCTAMLESFGESSNGPSDLGQCQASMVIGSSGFSSTRCDSVVFDEKPISAMVDCSGCLNNKATDLGQHEIFGMVEKSGFSLTHCDSVGFDEKPITAMESFTYLDNVPSDLGQHDVAMMIESCGFSTSCSDSVVFDEFGNSNNVPDDLGQHEAFMRINNDSALSSSNCRSLVLYEIPLSMNVESLNHSYVPTHDLAHDEVSVMSESEFPSWDVTDISRKSETSNRRRYNTLMKKVKTDGLELEDIKKYFDLPITEAAKELKVGVTLLKRRCRELNILRWPHRKIRSLNSLIETLKGLGLRNEVKMLEENLRLLEQVPNMELTNRTKKLRQSIFKANHNYKKKMSFPLLLG